MLYLSVAVALLALICVFNLLLTFGLIRRMRTSTTGNGYDEMLAAGVPAVGHRVEGNIGGTPALAGFFSADCEACEEQLPAFLAMAGVYGRDRVLAVVAATRSAGPEELVAVLKPAARVVVEAPEGELATAFGVRMWPAFAIVDDAGFVTSSAIDVKSLRAPASV